LRTKSIEIKDGFFRLWLISSDEQFACQDVTHEQYVNIIELNELIKEVDENLL
jgi:hypothetical protein